MESKKLGATESVDIDTGAESLFVGERLAEPELLDLSIDSSLSLEIARRRTIVYIDLRLPAGAVVHRGISRYIKAHLAGRNAICFEEDGLLRTGFAVEDHSPETLSTIKAFADQLGELLRTDDVVVYPALLPGTPGEKFSLQ